MDGKLKAAAIVILVGLFACLCASSQILNAIIGTAGSGAGQSFTYYVSQSTGSDSNPGTITQPFQTISKVNGLILTAGQSVGFKSGDTWREQLTVPSSGSSGSPITFSAYGGGSQPVINGSDLITGWSSGTTSSTVLQISQTSEAGNMNFGNITGQTKRAETFTTTGAFALTRIDIDIYASTTGLSDNVTLCIFATSGGSPTGSSLGCSASIAGSALPLNFGTLTTFTWGSTVALSASTKYAIVASRSGAINSSLYYKIQGLTSGSTFSGGSDGVFNGSAWSMFSAEVWNFAVYALVPGTTYYFQTVTTQPNQVFEDGARLALAASQAALGPGTYFWGSNTLSLITTGGDSPVGHVIESGSRSYAVNLNAMNHIAITGLHLTKSNGNGAYSTGTDTKIAGALADYNFGDGIYIKQATQPTLVSYNTVSYNGNHGIEALSSAYTQISNNSVDHNCDLKAAWTAPNNNGLLCAGIWVQATGPADGINVAVTQNTVALNGPSVVVFDPILMPGAGIIAWTSGDGINISQNYVHDNQAWGIQNTGSNHCLMSYNLTAANSGGLQIQAQAGFTPIHDCLVANNTLYADNFNGPQHQMYELQINGDDAQDAAMVYDNTIENNISVGNLISNLAAINGGQNDGTMGHGNIYLNNGFGPEASNFIHWGGNEPGVGSNPPSTFFSTYSAWETAAGNCGTAGCSNSVQADPQFVNASTGNFNLQAGSPAINTGTCITGVTPCPTNIGAK